MFPNWKKIYLTALLAFLQCFAPLLHAHTLEGAHATGVHMDFDHDVLELDHTDSGQPELKVEKTEQPAIGMAQEYKKDYFFFVADDHGALPPDVSAIAPDIQSSSSFVLQSKPVFRFYHLLPFSQAPPVSL